MDTVEPKPTPENARSNRFGAGILRALFSVLVADPYAIVTTPLAVLLVGSLIQRGRRDSTTFWSWDELFAGGVFTIAIAVFAVLAFGHLAFVIWEGVRNRDNSSNRVQ